MSWLQLRLRCDREHAPLIQAALEGGGALAVSLEDAGDEPRLEPAPGTTPLWPRVEVAALFADDPESFATARALAARLAALIDGEPAFETLDDRPWERVWLDDFVPTRFGDRLWVCPRGQRPDAEPDNGPDPVIVELDPGLAFGTGHHPTTALCLRWLDRAELAGRTLIDYGCGSGILAIAALRLGAARAFATDHDPQALEATLANARANAVADRLEIRPPEGLAGLQADLLIANILLEPLLALAPRLAALIHPGGSCALSGVLADQVTALSAAYAPFLDPFGTELEDDWALVAAGKPRCP